MLPAPTKSRYNPIIDKILSTEKHLSFSSLCAFRDSPSAFIAYQEREKETTPAMLFGEMVHCLVLQPDLFIERYFFIDDKEICSQIGGLKPRATNKYKEWYAEKREEAGSREFIEPDAYYDALQVAGSIIKNRASKKVLELCPVREKGIEWNYMNFRFLGFIDADGEKNIFDLKTCADAEPKKFQRDIVNNLYHVQAAMYLMAENLSGNGVKNFYHIAVDRVGGISVNQMDKALIEEGVKEYKRLLIGFNQCIIEERWSENYDFWSERYDGIYVAEKPGWMY